MMSLCSILLASLTTLPGVDMLSGPRFPTLAETATCEVVLGRFEEELDRIELDSSHYTPRLVRARFATDNGSVDLAIAMPMVYRPKPRVQQLITLPRPPLEPELDGSTLYVLVLRPIGHRSVRILTSQGTFVTQPMPDSWSKTRECVAAWPAAATTRRGSDATEEAIVRLLMEAFDGERETAFRAAVQLKNRTSAAESRPEGDVTYSITSEPVWVWKEWSKRLYQRLETPGSSAQSEFLRAHLLCYLATESYGSLKPQSRRFFNALVAFQPKPEHVDDLAVSAASKDISAEEMLSIARQVPGLGNTLLRCLSRKIGPGGFADVQNLLVVGSPLQIRSLLAWLARVTDRDDLRPRGLWEQGKWDREIAFWRSLTYADFKTMMKAP